MKRRLTTILLIFALAPTFLVGTVTYIFVERLIHRQSQAQVGSEVQVDRESNHNSGLAIRYAELEKLRYFLFLAFSVIGGMVVLLVIPISAMFSHPILRILSVIQEISKGNLDQTLAYYYHDEFGELINGINKMAKDLREANSNLKEKYRLQHQIEAAQLVQSALLPQTTTFPNVSIATMYRSAEQTGGDWYGIYHDKHHGKLRWCVGDVTGHGLSAAMVTSMISGSIATMEWSKTRKKNPEEKLIQLAQAASQVIRHSNMKDYLMTMVFLELDLKSGLLRIVNAGHCFPLRYLLGRESFKPMIVRGSRLGDINDAFTVQEFQLEVGESVIVYTDGLLENHGHSGHKLTIRDFGKTISASESPKELVAAVAKRSQSIWQNEPLADDVSLVVVKWLGEVESPQVANFSD